MSHVWFGPHALVQTDKWFNDYYTKKWTKLRVAQLGGSRILSFDSQVVLLFCTVAILCNIFFRICCDPFWRSACYARLTEWWIRTDRLWVRFICWADYLTSCKRLDQSGLIRNASAWTLCFSCSFKTTNVTFCFMFVMLVCKSRTVSN